MGIEAMFKDCKTDIMSEGSKAKDERLMALVLLIAIAYTCALYKGELSQEKRSPKIYCSYQRSPTPGTPT